MAKKPKSIFRKLWIKLNEVSISVHFAIDQHDFPIPTDSFFIRLRYSICKLHSHLHVHLPVSIVCSMNFQWIYRFTKRNPNSNRYFCCKKKYWSFCEPFSMMKKVDCNLANLTLHLHFHRLHIPFRSVRLFLRKQFDSFQQRKCRKSFEVHRFQLVENVYGRQKQLLWWYRQKCRIHFTDNEWHCVHCDLHFMNHHSTVENEKKAGQKMLSIILN